MKLRKKSDRIELASAASEQPAAASKTGGVGLDRRAFLRSSGLMAGGAALATTLTPGMMKRAKAQEMLDEFFRLAYNDENRALQDELAAKLTALDKEIRDLELRGAPIEDQAMQQLKHDRAELKDALYQRLVAARP